MTGVSSGFSVAALSGRCPRIALHDLAPSPFPATPLRTGREVLPHPALPRIVTHRRGRTPDGERSPRKGWISLASTHPAVLLPMCDPAAGPSLAGSSVVSRLLAVLCPAPTPSRRACASTEEGLSSSLTDCPCIPRPRRRGVLDGCASQGFTASVAFADLRAARLPLVSGPLRRCLTTRQPSLHAADCRFACRPQDGLDSGLHRPDFAGRCRSATRRLGPYRGQTFTGKPIRASLDTPQARHSVKRRRLCRVTHLAAGRPRLRGAPGATVQAG
jgi:hypothetical protein